MKRALVIASLLIAATALADKHSHTLADLKALVGQNAFKEAYQHLGDIPPAQRSSDWVDVAAAAAGGLLGTTNPDDGTTLVAIDEIDRTYPQILKSAKYTKPRGELGLKGLEGCFGQSDDYWSSYGLDNCVKLGLRFVDNSNGDPALALSVAKLARRSMNAYSSIPFFKRALATKNPAACKDDDLALAVASGLGLPPENAGDAKAIMVSCWDGVKDAVMKAFDEDSAHGYVRQNTCEFLKSKGAISGLQAKQCSHS